MKYLEMKKRAISSGGWWVDSSCLAAYRFKGANNSSAALLDMTGHGYHLTNVGGTSWSADSGFNLNHSGRYLTNSTLNGLGILTIIIRFMNLTAVAVPIGDTYTIQFSRPNSTSGLLGRFQINITANTETTHYDSGHTAWLSDTNSTSPMVYRESNADTPTSGILGGSSNYLYLNGARWASTNRSRNHDPNGAGGWNGVATIGRAHGSNGKFNALAAAFYSARLTEATHALIAANMMQF